MNSLKDIALLKDIGLLRKARSKEATLDLWGTPIKVWYLPQILSPKMLRELREVQEKVAHDATETSTEATTQESLEGAESGVQALLTAFLKTVVDWELSSGGVKIPLTEEGLDDLDLDILSEILRQLRELQRPNEPSGMPTNAPS